MSGPDDGMCVKSSRLKRVFFDCYRFCNLREKTFGIDDMIVFRDN